MRGSCIKLIYHLIRDFYLRNPYFPTIFMFSFLARTYSDEVPQFVAKVKHSLLLLFDFFLR